MSAAAALDLTPRFLRGDAATVLATLPDASVDCCVTSPPYWRKRAYDSGGIGGEADPATYVAALLRVLAQVARVLRREGSLWLNLGDTHRDKSLANIPWRVAIALTDEQGWVQRNTVVWHKVKGGPDNSGDRLRTVWEPVFHLTRMRRGYHYDVAALRALPRTSSVRNGAVVSATGVSGVRYRRRIELSTALSDAEKSTALRELDGMLEQVRRGELSDFRMVIRGAQRVTHSDSVAVSGRARELAERGFYFLRYHPDGAKPSDVWEVIPEDTQARSEHFAPFPEELCRLPILATCPPGGVVLDPFCGTGTANLAAMRLGRRSIGIDVSEAYLQIARRRCG